MDFFQSQDAARTKTGRLVLLFALAVVSIILSVYGIVSAALVFATKEVRMWNPPLFVAVVVVTILVVGLGSLYKIEQLRGGGRVVAEGLGGRLIPRDTDDLRKRRILNVVEEMAIASGTPVPPVYLLTEEKGINAFAAGYTPNDAVIGVTQGCIEQLDRSELQGVIGHEFSHVLNGDMRLNIRLIGILNGILVIGIIGYFILRSVAFSGRGRRRGSGKEGGAVAAIFAIGAGLAAVGFLGTVFGNLIKAAVARQREYLADASAVQFTRHPDSIGNALKRIGGLAFGAGIRNPHAAEASHMFFAKALTSGFTAMFTTHPALPDRIRRIDPQWDGTYLPAREGEPLEPAPSRREPAAGVGITEGILRTAILAGAAGAGSRAPGVEPTPVAQIGQPSEAHVEYAATLIGALPAPVVAAARETYGARAVIYALLLNREEDVRKIQLRLLAEKADEGVTRLVGELMPAMERVAPEARLPLIDMATAALRELTPAQYGRFRLVVMGLAEADEGISLFEWVLQRMILRHLDPLFHSQEPPRGPRRDLKSVRRQCAVLLSALANSGHEDADAARAAFGMGRDRLGLPGLEHLDAEACDLDELDRALHDLDGVSFALKRDLLEACSTCVTADRRVTVVEAELIRGIADALGCPMPPLLPGQRVG